ncbi:hypothetical protein GCM10009821_17460 [Aeromicrobium halocynthiae]|uniref:ABC transmembrane type-1 domain-containing protein n=1 Tax=Aeromicrobium halocynthiae TaxID=560557 RepID=A0ABP5HJ64_9ACTN
MLATTVLAQVLSVAVGFVLGLVMRQSAAGLVGYFVFAFVLPPISQLLTATQEWFADAPGWVDFTFTPTAGRTTRTHAGPVESGSGFAGPRRAPAHPDLPEQDVLR